MRDGRVNRAIAQGKKRVPELRERVPELPEELKQRGSELRSRGAELRHQGGELARQYAKMDVSWARCGYAKAARAGLLTFGLGPMIDFYVHNRVVGAELFDTLEHPVLFVANHSSHLDTPTILRALPPKWRRRTAVAAAADYFYDKRWKANGVALMFNTVPLGRKGGGLDNGATDHVDRLLDERWNLVMFPEGTRSRDGGIGKVHSGAAVIAEKHGIDIVPIYLKGTHEVEIRFGDPVTPGLGRTAREVMDEVKGFWDREGLAPEQVEQAPIVTPAPVAERVREPVA
jgi:1-acyl-sn-glycerol-3-phosphate acyltransferase